MSLSPVAVDTQLNNNGIKCVVYGKSGVGKTRLALTCPKPIILSAERGTLSIRGNGLQQLPEISTLAELVAAHNWVLNDKQAAQFDTVFVDSISEIAEVVLKTSKGSNKDGRKAHDEASTLVVDNIFRNFRNLPRKHVVMIAKERVDVDEYSKIAQSSPDMPNGKLRSALPHYFDFVFRYGQLANAATGEKWSGLCTFADPLWIAKDRSGKLAAFEPPHLGQLFAKAMQ